MVTETWGQMPSLRRMQSFLHSTYVYANQIIRFVHFNCYFGLLLLQDPCAATLKIKLNPV